MNLKNSYFLVAAGIFLRSILQDKYKDDLTNEIKTNGFALAPIKFEENELEKFIKFIQENMNFFKKYGSDFRLFGAEKMSSDIMNSYSNNLSLLNIAKKYIGAEIILQSTLAAKLTYEENNLGSGQGWHRDSYSSQFKSIIYLTNVDYTSGPFEYLKGSHKLDFIFKEMYHKKKNRIRPLETRYTNEEVDFISRKFNLEKIQFIAPKGTIILADTRGIHRGMPIISGCRLALTNYYIDARQFKAESI